MAILTSKQGIAEAKKHLKTGALVDYSCAVLEADDVHVIIMVDFAFPEDHHSFMMRTFKTDYYLGVCLYLEKTCGNPMDNGDRAYSMFEAFRQQGAI